MQRAKYKPIKKQPDHLQSPGTINNYISAIKFFYTHILDKDWNPKKIPRMKRIRKLPVIPPKQDILALLNATAT